MLLRRIIDHVKEQNWTAIVIDFFIVVAGVLLAIQITSWVNEQQDRRDEAYFLGRLHSDVMLAESGSMRVRERRLEVLQPLYSSLRIIFELSDRDSLTDEECRAIGGMATNMNVLELASFTELSSAGRINILREEQLRTALVEFQQLSASLNHHMLLQSHSIVRLSQKFPSAFSRRPRFDDVTGEIRSYYSCNLELIRNDPALLNAALDNAYSYDAFVRDELKPWCIKLVHVHELLDEILDISHDDPES